MGVEKATGFWLWEIVPFTEMGETEDEEAGGE